MAKKPMNDQKKNTKKYSINLGKGKKGRIEEQKIDGRDSKQITRW